MRVSLSFNIAQGRHLFASSHKHNHRAGYVALGSICEQARPPAGRWEGLQHSEIGGQSEVWTALTFTDMCRANIISITVDRDSGMLCRELQSCTYKCGETVSTDCRLYIHLQWFNFSAFLLLAVLLRLREHVETSLNSYKMCRLLLHCKVYLTEQHLYYTVYSSVVSIPGCPTSMRKINTRRRTYHSLFSLKD